MSTDSITDNEVAHIGKALGDPNRLAIYTQIAQSKELYCGEMHAKHAISAATLSHHLKILSDLGLITSRKDGQNVYYRAVPSRLEAYMKYLKSLSIGATRAGCARHDLRPRFHSERVNSRSSSRT